MPKNHIVEFEMNAVEASQIMRVVSARKQGMACDGFESAVADQVLLDLARAYRNKPALRTKPNRKS